MTSRINLGTIAVEFDDAASWVAAGTGVITSVVTPRNDPAVYAAMSLESNATYGRATREYDTPIDMSSGDVLCFEFYVDTSGSYLGPILIRFVFYDATWNYWSLTLDLHALRKGWNRYAVRKPLAADSYWTKSTTAPSWSAITSIQITTTPASGELSRVVFQSIRLGYVSTPWICLSSDDGLTTDITNVRPILANVGLTQTHYVTAPGTGEVMTRAQWDTLYGLGHGISCHGNHTRLTTVTGADMVAAIDPTLVMLLNYGYTKSARHFAYPYGEFNVEALGVVAVGHHTARTIGSSLLQAHPKLDGLAEYMLSAYSISSPVPTLATMQPHIQRAIDSDAYFHLFWHALSDATDLANFTAIMGFLADEQAAGNCRVGPMHEYYDWLCGLPEVDEVVNAVEFGRDTELAGTATTKYLCLTTGA